MDNKRRSERVLAGACVVLAVMQVLLVLVSWIVTSAAPELPVRSLLSDEGIRWFFGHFTSNMANPLLVWIILLSISVGVFSSSGLKEAFHAVCLRRRLMSRQRFALWLIVLMFLLYVLAIILLTCVPNAILLSSTGHLFPSSFAASLVPVIAFGIMILSVTYGTVSGTLASPHDIFRSMTDGIAYTKSLIVIYVFAVQLYYSLMFVF